ncbi:ATP-binding protein [Pikeienuella sp. HZG-20]|uniref:GAF domain-containing sensor histidine kinase n=1 Tax=Paludibacillus litoralis TaxID=3133267 RepID=UPI0030EBDBD7
MTNRQDELEARLAEVEDALLEREELFRVFNKFAVDIMAIDDEQALIWHVAREVVGKMGFNDCVIYLTDPLGTYLRQVAALGAKNPEGYDIINSLRIRMGQGVTGRVAETGKPIIIADLSKEPSYIPDLEPALSEICVPMLIDGKVVGVIDSEETMANVFTQNHLSILTTIAAIASSKLKLIREAEVTRRRNLELERTRERLERARKQAESASRVKNAFLATLSHELRTPMNGVIGMGELLSHTELSDRQRNFVQVLLASAKSMTGLMDDLLDVSMIEAGEMRLHIGDVDLNVMAQTLIDAIAAMETAKNVQVTLDFDESARGRWRCDEKRVRQILSNLTNNAVKFTDEGVVAVTIRAEPAGVRFEVKDNGPGIHESQLTRIFERFEQAEQTAARRHGGVGIGLNICRQLVALMKGEIGVESEEGEGALFWFTLPLERVQSPEGD